MAKTLGRRETLGDVKTSLTQVKPPAVGTAAFYCFILLVNRWLTLSRGQALNLVCTGPYSRPVKLPTTTRRLHIPGQLL